MALIPETPVEIPIVRDNSYITIHNSQRVLYPDFLIFQSEHIFFLPIQSTTQSRKERNLSKLRYYFDFVKFFLFLKKILRQTIY